MFHSFVAVRGLCSFVQVNDETMVRPTTSDESAGWALMMFEAGDRPL